MKFFNKAEDEDEFGMASQLKGQTTQTASASPETTNPVIHNTHESTPVVSPVASKPVRSAPISRTYGIEDVVNLMRTLPDAAPELVMPIVIKTLESANIDIDSIINEAADNEESIENNCVELIAEIETLELQIADMNDKIMAMNEDLEDICNVKNLLLSSMIEEGEELLEESDNDELVSELNLAEENLTDEIVEEFVEADADFDDVNMNEVISEVDKMTLAR